MKSKKLPVRKGVVTHKCIQSSNLMRHQELIERTNLLLFGNGTPKNGLLFKFDKFMDEHQAIIDDISEIRTTVKKAIEDSATTQRLLEKYKSDEEKFEEGKQAIIKLKETIGINKRANTSVLIAIIMSIFAFVGLGTNLYFNIKGHDSTIQTVEAVQDTIKQEIRYQKGVSKVTRGGYVQYNNSGISDSIKIK